MTAPNLGEIRPLGGTALLVPEICFGTACLGGMPHAYGYDVDAAQAKETVRTIFAGSVKFLDTAREYGCGRSESLIGEVIRELGGLPEGFVISTKLDRDMSTNRFDGAQARRSLEESLAAVQAAHDALETALRAKEEEAGEKTTALASALETVEDLQGQLESEKEKRKAAIEDAATAEAEFTEQMEAMADVIAQQRGALEGRLASLEGEAKNGSGK